jgi:hypothetical protein
MPAVQVKELTTAEEVLAHARMIQARRRACLVPVKPPAPKVEEIKPAPLRFTNARHYGPIYIRYGTPEWDAYYIPPETPARKGPPTVRYIARYIACVTGTPLNDLISPRREARVVRPRQIVMYLAKKLTSRSLPDIGRQLGGRDHTTVLHAVRKMERLCQLDSEFAAQIDRYIATLSEAEHVD